MKKRTRKKEYKAIIRAKERMNGWSGEHILDVLADGFMFHRGSDTRDRRAIRKVASAGTLSRQWDGWEFWLPSTREAMRAVPNKLTISGQMYNGHSSFENCPYEEITISFGDIRKASLSKGTSLLEQLCSNELVEAYLSDTLRI